MTSSLSPGWLWKRLKQKPWIRVLSGLLIVAACDTYAEDTDQEAPSIELLEYLASMVATEEGWVGPEEFQEFVVPDQAIIIKSDEPETTGGEDAK